MGWPRTTDIFPEHPQVDDPNPPQSEPDELPQEVSRGIINIGPIELEVIHLDNGQRLITVESLNKFLDFLEEGNTIEGKVEEVK